MKKRSDQHSHDEPKFRSVVVSKEGAAIQVERLELSPAMRRKLTAPGVKSIGPPKPLNFGRG